MKEVEKTRSINDLTREEQLETVKEHPWYIKYLDNQVEEICEIAVKSNPKVLCLVRNQTEKICIAAVSADYTTLAYVRDLTDAVIKEAINFNKDAVYYLPEDLFQRYKPEIV